MRPIFVVLAALAFNLAFVTPAQACPPGTKGTKCGGVSTTVTDRNTLATVTYHMVSGAVDPERVFHGDEQLWMVATVQQAGYYYLVNVGTALNMTTLFPLPGEQNYVMAGGTVSFGTQADPICVTPPFGQEDLYLVFSRTPLDTLAFQYIVVRESQTEGRNHVQLTSTSAPPAGTKSISATRSLAPTAATYSFDPTAEGAQVAYIRLTSAQ